MKLETGKYYLRNDGVKVGPANFRNVLHHRYGGYWVLDGWHYDEDGRHLYGYESKHLVSEWKGVTSMDIQVGDIVEHVNYKDMLFEVLAVHDKDVWVKIKGGGCPKTVYLSNLRKPAPKPVVEEVVMYTKAPTTSYWGYTADPDPVGRTHKITFNTVDGVADVTSIKMEKL